MVWGIRVLHVSLSHKPMSNLWIVFFMLCSFFTTSCLLLFLPLLLTACFCNTCLCMSFFSFDPSLFLPCRLMGKMESKCQVKWVLSSQSVNSSSHFVFTLPFYLAFELFKTISFGFIPSFVTLCVFYSILSHPILHVRLSRQSELFVPSPHLVSAVCIGSLCTSSFVLFSRWAVLECYYQKLLGAVAFTNEERLAAIFLPTLLFSHFDSLCLFLLTTSRIPYSALLEKGMRNCVTGQGNHGRFPN